MLDLALVLAGGLLLLGLLFIIYLRRYGDG